MEHLEDACEHPEWRLLQPWEYIRKYECVRCGAIAICACDEEFGARLPHQLDTVRPSDRPTERLPVTHGFLSGVCPTCRGEPEPLYPKADGYGSPSVLARHYWREIAKEAYLSFDGAGFPTPDAWRAARERVKLLHKQNPKYDLGEHDRGSPPVDLDIIRMDADYVRCDDGVGRWEHDGAILRVEDLVRERLHGDEWCVITCERRLPAALFGTFMGLVMQDIADPQCTPMMFGRRDRSGEQVWISMPMDHHQPAWFLRRGPAIKKHIEELEDWEFLLNYWWDAFADYRDYLWAGHDEYKELLEWLIELERDKVKPLLLYLAEDYWGRYTGWPDLLARRGDELRFFEVKSPNDRFSEDQIRWLNDNEDRLGFSVSIVRVKKR